MEIDPDLGIRTCGVYEDSTVYIPTSLLLMNDSDPNGDPIWVSLATSGDQNTVELSEKYGQPVIKFIPDPDFNGFTTFDYTITDPSGLSDRATVTVFVRPINH